MSSLASVVTRAATYARRLCDAAAAGVLAVLVLIVLWGVFTRFVLGDASEWTEELSRLLLVWLTMLGAAAASARAEHLGIDYGVQKLHADARAVAHATIESCVVAFAAAALVYGGAVLVVETLRVGQTTPALGLPMGFVYLAAPVSGCAIILFSVERLVARRDASLAESRDTSA